MTPGRALNHGRGRGSQFPNPARHEEAQEQLPACLLRRGISHYVTGNLKTAAREIRKELLAEIRKCSDARAVREVITFIRKARPFVS